MSDVTWANDVTVDFVHPLGSRGSVDAMMADEAVVVFWVGVFI
jgi:hypothetical protein